MSIFFNYNGQLYEDRHPVLSPENRSFKFGDGIFETIKLRNEEFLFKSDHFERLFEGLKTLGFKYSELITPEYFEAQIKQLVKINGHENLARIRLTVFRKDSDLINPDTSDPDFVIQSWPSPQQSLINDFNVNLLTGIFKSCDKLSNLKTNNFLPYIMAMILAKETACNECIILNNHGRICDASRGNVFTITDDIIYTPPLSEGCIAGVMRRNLLTLFKNEGLEVIEKPLHTEDVLAAHEMFITNVITGIQPVSKFLHKSFTLSKSLEFRRITESTFSMPGC